LQTTLQPEKNPRKFSNYNSGNPRRQRSRGNYRNSGNQMR
jgi:hypothetical protein